MAILLNKENTKFSFTVGMFERLNKREFCKCGRDERKENALWLKNKTQCVTEFDCTIKRMNRRGTKKNAPLFIVNNRAYTHTHAHSLCVNLT